MRVSLVKGVALFEPVAVISDRSTSNGSDFISLPSDKVRSPMDVCEERRGGISGA